MGTIFSRIKLNGKHIVPVASLPFFGGKIMLDIEIRIGRNS